MDETDPCEGGVGVLSVTNLGEEISEYQWADAEGIISATLDQDNIEVDPTTTTDFSVTVKNAFGCEATFTEKVEVSVLEGMLIIPERDTIFKGDFTPIKIEPQGAYTVEWEANPSLESMSGFDQIAMPEETTTYTLTIIDDATGCSINKEVTIFVKSVACGTPNIFFPNAFSPNGDGKNDLFTPISTQLIPQMQTVIYNRWGHQIYSSNNLNIDWDGTLPNGSDAPPTTYYWSIGYSSIDGDQLIEKGTVTLIR